MSDSEMINGAEYAVEKRPEGRLKRKRLLLVMAYILFPVVAFLGCYISRIIPLFAVVPIFLWMLIYFTWRYVSIDVGYTFESGVLTFFTVLANRSKRIRKDGLTVTVKNAQYVGWLTDSAAKKELGAAQKTFDYVSERRAEDAAVLVFTDEKGRKCAVLFNCIPKVKGLIRRFYPDSKL